MIRDLVHPGRADDATFLSRNGKRLHDRDVRRILDRYIMQSGLSPRMTRPRFHHLLNAGADIRSVQELLGHAI